MSIDYDRLLKKLDPKGYDDMYYEENKDAEFRREKEYQREYLLEKLKEDWLPKIVYDSDKYLPELTDYLLGHFTRFK